MATMTQRKARELAREYVQGELSYRQLAEKHGFTKGQVNYVGSRNHWATARAIWRGRMMRDALDAPRGEASIVCDKTQSASPQDVSA